MVQDQQENTVRNIAQIFGDDELVVVTHAGVSQYSRELGGESACGLAALNCARLVFQKQRDDVVGEDLIRWLLSRSAAQEITSICNYWVNSSHLNIEDVVKVPFFSHSLSLAETYHEQCEWGHFRTLLRMMQAVSTTSAAVITKPPEIVACVKVPTLKGDIFVIFDSHVRPNHPSGAAFIFSRSLEKIADYLSRLFWVETDSYGGKEALSDWQEVLLRQFCGNIVVPKDPDSTLEPNLGEALLEASMSILSLTAEVADLKAKNSALIWELHRTKEKIFDMEKHEFAGPSNGAKMHKDQRSRRRSNTNKAIQSIAETSITSNSNVKSNARQKGTTQEYSGLHGQNCNDVPISRRLLNTEKLPTTPDSKTQQENMDFALVLELADAVDLGLTFERSKHRKNGRHKGLVGKDPTTLVCRKCVKKQRQDSMVRVSRCLELFCRGCMEPYVLAALQNDLYPIPCPSCDAGVVDDTLIKQLGIYEEQSVSKAIDYPVSIPPRCKKDIVHEQHAGSRAQHVCSSSSQSTQKKSFAQTVRDTFKNGST